MSQPLPWSHSALQDFNTCARRYEEIKVLRHYQDSKNSASLWGDEFHRNAERYIADRVAGKNPRVLITMGKFIDYLEQFVTRPGVTVVERKYALNAQMLPCEFLGEDVWARGIIDVLTINGAAADVDDHKTGKRKKDPQQLMIFALLVFYHHPQVMRCDTRFHWISEGYAKDEETYHRHDIPWMWDELLPKLRDYRDAFHKGVFPPKRSGLCAKHCPVDSCEFFGRGPRG